MTKALERVKEGRATRLRAEVLHRLQGVTVKYSCIYLRSEQANQYNRGWCSVTDIDIDLAVKQIQGQGQCSPNIAQQSLSVIKQKLVENRA